MNGTNHKLQNVLGCRLQIVVGGAFPSSFPMTSQVQPNEIKASYPWVVELDWKKGVRS